MPPTSGYSATPLIKKLGIKHGFVISLVNEPPNYLELFDDWPLDVAILKNKASKKNFIHFFTTTSKELFTRLPVLKAQVVDDGMIWVSWPKKSAKVPTDITEDVIRDYALSIGLVVIKVCAVNETWSGLKLVIPVAKRKK